LGMAGAQEIGHAQLPLPGTGSKIGQCVARPAGKAEESHVAEVSNVKKRSRKWWAGAGKCLTELGPTPNCSCTSPRCGVDEFSGGAVGLRVRG
jgi:hypothetical protein